MPTDATRSPSICICAMNLGRVRVENIMVGNGNRGLSDEANHHKSYDYLVTPELS